MGVNNVYDSQSYISCKFLEVYTESGVDPPIATAMYSLRKIIGRISAILLAYTSGL